MFFLEFEYGSPRQTPAYGCHLERISHSRLALAQFVRLSSSVEDAGLARKPKTVIPKFRAQFAQLFASKLKNGTGARWPLSLPRDANELF